MWGAARAIGALYLLPLCQDTDANATPLPRS